MKNIYKYVPPERIDILENNRIRFTQPKYLNDPFDMYLSFNKLVEKEEFLKYFDSEKLYVDIINKINDSSKKKNYPYSFEELFGIFSKGKIFKTEFKKIIDSLSDLFTSDNRYIKELFYNEMNKRIGVLSLTNTPNNIPMWAHYSKVHQGFVIVFNAEHKYFNGGLVDDKDFGKLKEVIYEEDKYVFDSFKDIKTNCDFLFKKHHSWEYEKEWRMLLPLEKRTELKEPDIYLKFLQI
ncbi:MAG: DUF2971 domain-containing protein [Bacteroidota bacterium]